MAAVCEYCTQEMTDDAGCTLSVYDDFTDGVTRRRIRNRNRACGDCGVPPRAFHHPGCDLERCPACRRQALSCGCTAAAEHVEEEEVRLVYARRYDEGVGGLSGYVLDEPAVLLAAIREAAQASTRHGPPALHLSHPNGSSLVVATTQVGAFVVWYDVTGASFRGRDPRPPVPARGHVTFDHLGARTEAPAALAVAAAAAEAAALAFLETGQPHTSELPFVPLGAVPCHD